MLGVIGSGAGSISQYMSKGEYRDGGRVNALMSGQATNLSDEDIQDLSAYYASLTKQEGVAAEAIVMVERKP